MRVALLIEHPSWSLELIERFAVRDVELIVVDVGVDPRPIDVDLVVNRVNVMPSAGRTASVVASTLHLLLAYEALGVRVVNGHRAHAIGASKSAQAAVFAAAGVATPATIAVASTNGVRSAARELGGPVLVKPNVGGSGSGIVRFDSADDVPEIVDLGIDGTGVVQRVVTSLDGLVHRVELLGDELFYATDQQVQAGVFNYCAADGCAPEPGAIALVTPPAARVADAARILALAGMTVGGVEYLVDAEGTPRYYDLNPYSNFVQGRAAELGFDPIDRYLDHVLGHLDAD